MKMRVSFLLALTLLTVTPSLHGQGTAFTYQGRLTDAHGPANGSYDLTFTLFNSITGGAASAGPVTNSATAASNGLFTATIDFGSGVFTGASNWLEIAVGTNGANNFTTLTPRQQLTPTPYAIYAAQATLATAVPGGAITGAMLANGAVTAAKLAPGAIPTDYTTNLGVLDNSRFYQLTPPLRLNDWPDYWWTPYAGTPSQTEWTTNMYYWKTNGMLAAGWKWMEFDDAWTATNRNAQGRYGWNTNKYPNGLPWLTGFAHTNGFFMTAYISAPGARTCSGFPGSTLPQLGDDIVELTTYGFDGLRVDASCGGSYPGGWGFGTAGEARAMCRIINEAAARAGDYASSNVFVNRALVAHVGLNAYPGNDVTNGIIPMEAWYSINGLITFGGATAYSTAKASADIVRNYVFPYQRFIRPGHWVDLQDITPLELNRDTNSYRMMLDSRIMGAATMAITSSFTEAQHPEYHAWFTNQEFFSYYEDPAVICGHSVSSNNYAEVWVRPLGSTTSGTNLVCFINLATNGSVSQTISAAQLNVASNLAMVLRDPWRNLNVATFTNVYTYANANTNLKTFVTFPATFNAPQGIIAGTNGAFTVDGSGNVAATDVTAAAVMATTVTASDFVASGSGYIGNGFGLTNINPAPLTNCNEWIHSGIIICNGGNFNKLDLGSSSPADVHADDGLWVASSGGTFQVPVPSWVTQAVCMAYLQSSSVGADYWTNTVLGAYYQTNNRVFGTSTTHAVNATTNATLWTWTNAWPNVSTISREMRITFNAATNPAAKYFLCPIYVRYQ